MIRLPEIKTAELSTYGNFAKCHQAHFRVSRVGLGTRLTIWQLHTLSYELLVLVSGFMSSQAKPIITFEDVLAGYKYV